MISWIQSTFQHHFKTIFAVLLAVTIVSFIFTIGATPGLGGADRRIKKKEFFGYNIASLGVERQVNVDAQISTYLHQRYLLPLEHPFVKGLGRERLAGLALADRHRIAAPTEAELSQFITALPAFQDDEGRYDSRRYAEFSDQLKTSSLFTVADVRRVMIEDFRIHRINDLLAGPGYALPAEVGRFFSEMNTRWTVRVARFDLDTFNPVIAPTEAALAAYFEQKAGNYRIPVQVRVDYVLFKSADFAGNEPLNDNDVVAFFEANKARFAGPSADPAKPPPAPELAAVRPQVEAAMRELLAAHKASAAASDFAYALFSQKVAQDSPVVDQLAAQYRGKRLSAPAFSPTTPPKNLPWPPAVLAQASRLNKERYYSDALPVGSDQIVFLWQETLPEHAPALVEVRDRVLADFTAEERGRLLTAAGRQWKGAVQAQLAGGASFENAVAAVSGAPKHEVSSFGPFTLEQPPAGLGGQIIEAIAHVSAGGLTDLLLDRDPKKAFLVQVVERSVPAVEPNAPEYARSRDQLMRYAAARARASLTGELVEQETARTEAAAR